MILIYTECKFGKLPHFFRTLFDRKLEVNLFYKLNITLMGLCLPSLDINVVFTRQLCGKSIHLKSLMYIFQRIGVYVTFHITQAFVLITLNTPWHEIYTLYLRCTFFIGLEHRIIVLI